MTAKKKAAKKAPARKSRAAEWQEPAPDSNVPKGMTQLGRSYAKTWQPEEGESLYGTVTSGVRS